MTKKRTPVTKEHTALAQAAWERIMFDLRPKAVVKALARLIAEAEERGRSSEP